MIDVCDIELKEVEVGATSPFSSAEAYRTGLSSINRSCSRNQISLFGALVFTGTQSLTTPQYLIEHLGTSNLGFHLTVRGAKYEKNLVYANTAAKNLTQIRKVFHSSVTELANLFGVSRQAIYDWQAGRGISGEHAEKLEMLARATVILASAGAPGSQLLRRKLRGGKTFFEIVRAGDSAEVAALELASLVKRDLEQRQRLEARLSGRKRPAIDRGDMGLPMLSEEE